MNDPSFVRAPVQPGDILAGRYRVDRVLGVGGMGVVVAARHLQLDDLVALKFLLPECMNDPEVVTRFAREARAAVKIKNEHVAKVTDVGTLESGAPYMVMEYLEGTDLSQLVESRGPLAVDDAVDFILQACEAVGEAHSLGIVHRDLKPANLFIIRRPDGARAVKVLDFGISKMVEAGGLGRGKGASMTRTAAVLGSPLYMSPEQLTSSRDVDARTDLWALGVILFEMLTGQPPFQAETLPQLAVMIVQDPTPSLRTWRPDLPEGLNAVVQHCLQKDRARRYSNVAELAIALAEFAPARSRLSIERTVHVIQSAGRPPGPGGGVGDSADPGAPGIGLATASAWGHTARGTSRRRSLSAIVIGVAAAALVATVVVLFALRRPSPSPQQPASIGDMGRLVLPSAAVTPSGSADGVAMPTTVGDADASASQSSVAADASDVHREGLRDKSQPAGTVTAASGTETKGVSKGKTAKPDPGWEGSRK
jgi:eukaryotic-like serine/threonine-protein kinase